MKFRNILILAGCLLAFMVVPVSADIAEIPSIPAQLYGTLYNHKGEAFPAGTVIIAEVNGVTSTFTLAEAGKIGGSGTFDDKFLISGATAGSEITFKIKGSDVTVKEIYSPGSSQQTAQVQLVIPIEIPKPTPTGNVPQPTATPSATPTVTPTAAPTLPEIPTEPVVIPPAEKVVEEKQMIVAEDTEILPTGNTVSVVELKDTTIIQSVAVPEEVAKENPGASVKVTEGNVEEVTLPATVKADDVHIILTVSVVTQEERPVKVVNSGFFVLNTDVPAGKKLAVGHHKNGVWVDCKVEYLGNGQHKVFYNGLSPFAVVFIEELAETPFVEEVVTPTESPKSPTPVLGMILGGLSAAVILRRK